MLKVTRTAPVAAAIAAATVMVGMAGRCETSQAPAPRNTITTARESTTATEYTKLLKTHPTLRTA
jgi:hypothetical protein